MATQKPNIVPYKELLRRGHEAGLESILTEIVQIPSAANDGVAIMRATVTLAKDGLRRTFQATGDAARNNVAPAMQTCLLRMSETRAKARALRDAVNAGEVAAEELADYEDSRPSAVPTSRPGANGQPTINDSGSQCPLCRAPDGKPHVRSCVSLKQAA